MSTVCVSAYEAVKKADSGITAVVLTALELEYHALREHLTELRVWEHAAGTLFEIGTVRGTGVRIALAVAGEGNQASAVVTERACGAFSPRMLLLVGVAGALHADVALGDVVVATRVYGYHGGKEGPSGFLARPRAWDAPHHLEQRARYLTRTLWWQRLLPEVTNCGFRIHFKPVLAGEVVFDSRISSWAELAHRHYNDAVAVEMESAGVSHAARLNRSLPVLTIRGISDRADGEKATSDSAGWPAVAAARAAAFALALVTSVEEHANAAVPSTRQHLEIAATHPPTTWQRHALVDHDRLFGVDGLIGDVRDAIVSQTGHWVVSLFGEGGVGKTAIAYSAVAESAAEGAFSRIAWVPAPGPGATFDLMPRLSRQLGFDLGQCRSLRPDERVLIVIDNAESLEDAAGVVQCMRDMGLTRPHKLLVTTRWQLRPALVEATEYSLRPLADPDAVALIRHLGAGDRLLRSLDDPELRPILEVAEGNPFLLKLVIGRYLSSHLPLELVLDAFRDLGRVDDVDDKSLTDLVRIHLYERSLGELERRFGSRAVTALLSSFCARGRGYSLGYAELAAVSGLDGGSAFPGILVDACRLCLVTVSGAPGPRGGLDRIYGIHHLLHDLTCGCRPMC